MGYRMNGFSGFGNSPAKQTTKQGENYKGSLNKEKDSNLTNNMYIVYATIFNI